MSVICFLCDSYDDACYSEKDMCVGKACIKREVFIDGMIRTQRSCQMSGDFIVENCHDMLLWRGRYGTECVCQLDYCNSYSKLLINFYLIPSIILILLGLWIINI